MLLGTHTVRIDDKGRLKLPSDFRQYIEQQWGSVVYLTSPPRVGVPHGQLIQIYPLPVWTGILRGLEDIAFEEAGQKFSSITSYFGQLAKIDEQGRIQMSQRLRQEAAMTGEVDVTGEQDHLLVAHADRLADSVRRTEWTTTDARVLNEVVREARRRLRDTPSSPEGSSS